MRQIFNNKIRTDYVEKYLPLVLPDLPDGDGGGSGRVPLQAMEHFGHPLLTVDAPHAVESVTVWTPMLLGQPHVRLHPDQHQVTNSILFC